MHYGRKKRHGDVNFAHRDRRGYVRGGVAYIPLTRGEYAKVELADRDSVAQFLWKCRITCGKKYAARCVSRKTVQMHRYLMGNSSPLEIDHINGDGLDNRRSNLRFATPSQNKANRKKVDGCRSKYKGVAWYERDKLWGARICKNGQGYTLGYSKNEQDCAIMYDVAAQLLHGEFAVLNFPIKK